MRHTFYWDRSMLALIFCLAAVGCSAGTQMQGPEMEPLPRGLARPALSQLVAPPGSRVAVAIEIIPGNPALAGLQGDLRFDPAKLSYVGQAPIDTLGFPLIIVNDAFAAQGLLRIISFDPDGLETFSAELVFDVRASDYAGTLRYTTVQGLDLALTPEPISSTPVPAHANPDVVMPAGAVRMSAEHWNRLGRSLEALKPARLIDSIPTGRRYGDVDTSGAINLLDAIRVLSWAVGSHYPIGIPIPQPGDFAELAGNVGPTNLPGLGEASDIKGPGWGTDCTRTWQLLDGALIAAEVAGANPAVVGEMIPSDAVDPATKLPRRGSACDGGGSFPLASNNLAVPDDSLLTITSPTDTGFVYYRTMAVVRFKASASNQEKYAVLTKYQATIVGGTAWLQRYTIRFPDPGATWQQVADLIEAINSEPAVLTAYSLDRSSPVGVDGRYPNEGNGLKRSDWFGTSDTTWALRAIRAPLAWGCENGEYGTSPVVGVIDPDYEPRLEDLQPSLAGPVVRPGTSGGRQLSQSRAAFLKMHGSAMAGAVTGAGDNGRGIAGSTYGISLLVEPTSPHRPTLWPSLVSIPSGQLAVPGRFRSHFSRELHQLPRW